MCGVANMISYVYCGSVSAAIRSNVHIHKQPASVYVHRPLKVLDVFLAEGG